MQRNAALRSCLILLTVITTCVSASAADKPTDEIRVAIQKTLPWLQKGAAGSSKHNKCFTCHNHGLPIIALIEAQRQGFEVDQEILDDQLQHTRKFLQSGEKRYLEGKGQGGRVLTAGYAMWALQAGSEAPNKSTEAAAGYLVNNQSDKDHWKQTGRRPPSDGAEFTTTFVALRAIHHYCGDELTEQKNKRFAAAAEWLTATKPNDTEDAVFQLKSLKLLLDDAGASEVITSSNAIATAVDNLIEQQREDGGWAQLPDMDSDAYATATVLTALLRDGGLSADHSAVTAAIKYLLDTQLEDGTWHVVTRADGFQPYYESGFPHAEDQFISIAASSWAVIALMETLPEQSL